MDRALRYALLGGLVRLLLAPFFMHAWDVATILESVNLSLRGGNVYQQVAQATAQLREATGLPINYEGYAYLPQVLLIYLPFYALYLAIGGVEHPIVNGHGATELIALTYPDIYLFLVSMKLPVIMADAAIAYLLAKRRPWAGLLYALSPYSVMITSVWGNFDSLVGLCLLLSYLSFKERRMLSGFFYGLSLMKPYSLVALPVFLLKSGRGRGLQSFLAGLAVSLIPAVAYLVLDPGSMTSVLLYHAYRPPKGLNIYNAALFLQGLKAAKVVGTIAPLALLGAVALVVFKVASRHVQLLEALVASLAVYLVFGPVTNEQHLAALLPLALLCESCWLPVFLASHLPLLYALFNAKPTYFAIPIMWSTPQLHEAWRLIDLQWGLTATPYISQVLYLLSLLFTAMLIAVACRCLGTVSVR